MFDQVPQPTSLTIIHFNYEIFLISKCAYTFKIKINYLLQYKIKKTKNNRLKSMHSEPTRGFNLTVL
jgi:hypothetical protein